MVAEQSAPCCPLPRTVPRFLARSNAIRGFSQEIDQYAELARHAATARVVQTQARHFGAVCREQADESPSGEMLRNVATRQIRDAEPSERCFDHGRVVIQHQRTGNGDFRAIFASFEEPALDTSAARVTKTNAVVREQIPRLL